MRYPESYYYEEEKRDYSLYVYISIIMLAVVVAVIGIIFITNKPKGTSKGFQIALAQSSKSTKLEKETKEVVKSVDELISGSTLTSDQLDIWTLPDTGREDSGLLNDTRNGILKNKTTGEILTRQDILPDSNENADMMKEETNEDQNKPLETDTDLFASGEFDLSLSDGSTRHIVVNDAISKNEWDLKCFSYEKPEMKYYEGKEQISTFGVDLSSQAGKVDFSKLKRAGCDYVMIRAGQRGYASGTIIMDSECENLIEKALKSGIDVGLYFYSQALTREEALEEADCVIALAEDYKITYPVMFDMECIEGDLARTDALDNDMRTKIALTFLQEIREAGFVPVLYGNREWLLTKLNLEELTDYQICYAQNSEAPEYPYHFSMWNYEDEATLNGVENDTRLFINLKSYK